MKKYHYLLKNGSTFRTTANSLEDSFKEFLLLHEEEEIEQIFILEREEEEEI